MKENIINLFSDILSENDVYYCGNIPIYTFENLFLGDYSDSFIIRILTRGEKIDSEILDNIRILDKIRKRHIISCFLLGIVFYRKLGKVRTEINSFIRKNFNPQNENVEEQFSYMWMICCLFHDLGYPYESGIKNATQDILKDLPNCRLGIPSIFTKKLFYKYWEFKYCRFGQLDHGICGGAIYYKKICELRQIKQRDNRENLYWGEDMIKVYAHLAMVIACHNIFFQPKSQCYICKGLEKLLIEEDYKGRVNIEHHPFLYLFSIIDTLEPIKVVNQSSKLNQIFLSFNENKCEYDIANLCIPLQESFKKRYVNMKGWLNNYTNYVSLKFANEDI